MPNENLLAGMRCPNEDCGSYGPFQVRATTLCEVADDGVDSGVQFDWSNGSFCHCVKCSEHGIIGSFMDNFVVVDSEFQEVVYGPAKLDSCHTFVLGTRYHRTELNSLFFEVWERYEPKEGEE